MGGLGPIGFALQGLSMIMQGAAQAQGQQYEAAKSERAAEIGRVQANQIDTAYRDDLNTTISNIRAIRASTGAAPDSPSSLAYIDAQATASDRTRRIKAGAARMQATSDDNDAVFYKQSASSSLLGGFVGALPYFLKAA